MQAINTDQMIGLHYRHVSGSKFARGLPLTKSKKSVPDFIPAGYLLPSAICCWFLYMAGDLGTGNQRPAIPFGWSTLRNALLFYWSGQQRCGLYVKSVTEQQHFRFKPARCHHPPAPVPRTQRKPIIAHQGIIASSFYFIDCCFKFRYTAWDRRPAGTNVSTENLFLFNGNKQINPTVLVYILVSTDRLCRHQRIVYIVNATFRLMSRVFASRPAMASSRRSRFGVIGFSASGKAASLPSSHIDLIWKRLWTLKRETPTLTSDEEIFVHRLLAFMNSEKSLPGIPTST